LGGGEVELWEEEAGEDAGAGLLGDEVLCDELAGELTAFTPDSAAPDKLHQRILKDNRRNDRRIFPF